jgi:hypothetical protein
MALSNFFNAIERNTNLISLPVYQSTTIYAGAIVAMNSTGYAIGGTTTAGLLCAGRAEETVDNSSGSSGDKYIRIRRGCFRWLAYDTIVATDRGKPVFMYSDSQVALGSGSSVCGTIIDVDSVGVWVEVGTVNGTSLAAEIVSRSAISTDLASTGSGKGASLVGIYDTAAKITATTVEGALAENIDARRIALGTDGNTLPVPLVMISKTIANSAGDTDITLNATYGGIRVTNVIVEKAAASSTGGDATITVKNTATAITEAMALSGLTAGLVYRNTTIVPAAASIASGGILRITSAKSTGDCACTVTVYGYRVA